MHARVRASGTSAGGVMIACTGLAFIAAGVWGRREVRASLARERSAGRFTALGAGLAAADHAG